MTLLEVLRRNGILVESVCGGRGRCGKCLVVTTPAPPPSLTDRSHLNPEDVARGVRLACQHFVTDGLVVRIASRDGHLPLLEPGVRLTPRVYDRPWESDIGIAIDVGTTTVSYYIVGLPSGNLLCEASHVNPQVSFGTDVIARIEYASDHEDGVQVLREVLLRSIDHAIHRICDSVQSSCDQIRRVSVVGNTAMTHILLGLDLRPLGRAPYSPVSVSSRELSAAELGLSSCPEARVYTAPMVAGFVGGDTVGFVMAQSIDQHDGVVLGIDIGTNTEIVLGGRDGLWCCSAAAGPAFEGATISRGMRAEPGAISHVSINDPDGAPLLEVIGDEQTPRGLCGSGILDLVAEMTRAGIVDCSGSLVRSRRVIDVGPYGRAYLVHQDDRGHSLLFTQDDVRQVQLAKAAIAAGAATLMRTHGISPSQLDVVYIAGAFGSHLSPTSALTIGMLPPVSADRVISVGNAAGVGARSLLLSAEARRRASRIARAMVYTELVRTPIFRDLFLQATLLGQTDIWTGT
ncbi:MAG: ASKHA domain-containing protein [Candidatus Thorarchaeota archaeon]